VSGGGVEGGVVAGIEPQVGGGNELSPQLAAQGAVEAREHGLWILGAPDHGLGGNLNHGRDQGGGNAVPGDIGDEDADMSFVDREKFVEVSGDGGHGAVGGADVESIEVGDGRRKDGGLNVAGDGEFVLYREETAFVVENELQGAVSETEEKNGEANVVEQEGNVPSQGPSEICRKRFQRKGQAAEGEDSKAVEDKILARERWYERGGRQGRQDAGRDPIVFRNDFVGDSGSYEERHADDGDDESYGG